MCYTRAEGGAVTSGQFTHTILPLACGRIQPCGEVWFNVHYFVHPTGLLKKTDDVVT